MRAYIKKEDYLYFETLLNTLDETRKQKFINLVTKGGCERTGIDIKKIKVVDDSIYNVQAIQPDEMITRTLIKKAFKQAKEG